MEKSEKNNGSFFNFGIVDNDYEIMIKT